MLKSLIRPITWLTTSRPIQILLVPVQIIQAQAPANFRRRLVMEMIIITVFQKLINQHQQGLHLHQNPTQPKNSTKKSTKDVSITKTPNV